MIESIKSFFKKKTVIERDETDSEKRASLFTNINKNEINSLSIDISTVDIKSISEEEEPSYPPIIDGLNIKDPLELVKRQKELIAKIRASAGIGVDTNQEFFDEFYLEPIIRLAALVQELPASEYDHHRGAGGLFEHSLEVSLNALKIAKGYFLPPVGTVEVEHERKKRWEYAAWLASLLHDAGKPMTMMKIISEKGTTWSSYTTSLYDWSKEEDFSRYVIVWNDNRKYEDHKRAAVSWFYKIASEKVLNYLQKGDGDRLIEEVTFALTDYSHQQGYISNIIRKSDSISVQLDFERRVNRILGKKRVSLATEFVNTIRHLKSVSWQSIGYNKPNSMIWVIDGDVYLSWPDSIKIILFELQNRNISIPTDYIQAAQILESKRLIVPPSSGGVYVFKPNDYEDVVQLIKLAGSTLFFDGDVLPPSIQGVFTNFEMQRKQEVIKRYIENAIEAGEDIDVVSRDLNERIQMNTSSKELEISKSSDVAPKVFTSKMSATEILEAQNEVTEIKEKARESKGLALEIKEKKTLKPEVNQEQQEDNRVSVGGIKIRNSEEGKKQEEKQKPASGFKIKSQSELPIDDISNVEQKESHDKSEKAVEAKTKETSIVKTQEKKQIIEQLKKSNPESVSGKQAVNKIKSMKTGVILQNVNGVLDEESGALIIEPSKIESKNQADEYLKSKKQAGAFIKEIAEKIRTGHFQKISAEDSPVHSTKKISNVSLIILDFDVVCREVGRTSPSSALKSLREYGMLICQNNNIGENCIFDYIVNRENQFKKEKRVLLNADTSEAILYYAEVKKAKKDSSISDELDLLDKYSGGIKLSKQTMIFFDLIVEAIKQGKDWKIDFANSIVWVETKFVVGYMNENIQDEVLFKTELESNIDKSKTEKIQGRQIVYLPEKWMKEVVNHVSKK